MNQHEETTAIAPTRKFSIMPQRREDYPVIPTPSGDHIVMPIKDYRKFRGETSHWQFISLTLLAGVLLITWEALNQPPIYVEKPFLVEKEKPVVVPSKCVVFCGR